MVCIIQMGSVGSSMATPMLEKQRAPGGGKKEKGSASGCSCCCLGQAGADGEVLVRRDLTRSHQDVGIPQQGEHRRALGALVEMEGSRVLWAGGTRAALPPTLLTAPFPSPLRREERVLTSGEILEGCRMQSCKAGKKMLLLG